MPFLLELLSCPPFPKEFYSRVEYICAGHWDVLPRSPFAEDVLAPVARKALCRQPSVLKPLQEFPQLQTTTLLKVMPLPGMSHSP